MWYRKIGARRSLYLPRHPFGMGLGSLSSPSSIFTWDTIALNWDACAFTWN